MVSGTRSANILDVCGYFGVAIMMMMMNVSVVNDFVVGNNDNTAVSYFEIVPSFLPIPSRFVFDVFRTIPMLRMTGWENGMMTMNAWILWFLVPGIVVSKKQQPCASSCENIWNA
jgi:hypothetical protein